MTSIQSLLDFSKKCNKKQFLSKFTHHIQSFLLQKYNEEDGQEPTSLIDALQTKFQLVFFSQYLDNSGLKDVKVVKNEVSFHKQFFNKLREYRDNQQYFEFCNALSFFCKRVCERDVYASNAFDTVHLDYLQSLRYLSAVTDLVLKTDITSDYPIGNLNVLNADRRLNIAFRSLSGSLARKSIIDQGKKAVETMPLKRESSTFGLGSQRGKDFHGYIERRLTEAQRNDPHFKSIGDNTKIINQRSVPEHDRTGGVQSGSLRTIRLRRAIEFLDGQSSEDRVRKTIVQGSSAKDGVLPNERQRGSSMTLSGRRDSQLGVRSIRQSAASDQGNHPSYLPNERQIGRSRTPEFLKGNGSSSVIFHGAERGSDFGSAYQTLNPKGLLNDGNVFQARDLLDTTVGYKKISSEGVPKEIITLKTHDTSVDFSMSNLTIDSQF
ncbi:hypothetical protein OAP83_03230, partial [Rickettsiales bacterium]|nr:hypothetical protein [Rickettsiales bacterium]